MLEFRKRIKKKFQKFITNYFKQRKQLVSAFLLIDIRHEPQPIDLNFMQWLGENYIPFSIVFTKADKLKPAARERNINNYTNKMLETQWEELPPIFITSSLHKTGSEEILTYINSLNKDFTETNPL
jgi:GTP-binding protein